MKEAKAIRVLCVDDHPLVREGIAAVIAAEDDMVSVGAVGDGQAALAQYRQLKPDVVIMDLRMPVMGGVEATIQIRKEFPAARIIVLTTYEGDEDIHRALEAGAQAYLLKDSVSRDLMRTIREVHAGHRHIAPTMAARLAEHTPRVALTEREMQILELVAAGLRNKEIGASLNIVEDTVKIHLRNIFSKLQVMDRTQAVVSAAQRGFIDLHPHTPEGTAGVRSYSKE
jgi:DNA-binding NarL/FixJ family response regulator